MAAAVVAKAICIQTPRFAFHYGTQVPTCSALLLWRGGRRPQCRLVSRITRLDFERRLASRHPSRPTLHDQSTKTERSSLSSLWSITSTDSLLGQSRAKHASYELNEANASPACRRGMGVRPGCDCVPYSSSSSSAPIIWPESFSTSSRLSRRSRWFSLVRRLIVSPICSTQRRQRW